MACGGEHTLLDSAGPVGVQVTNVELKVKNPRVDRMQALDDDIEAIIA